MCVMAVAIIPVRYSSKRLPGKPLLNETGKPLIQHVVESASPARLISRVIVATDDQRIMSAVSAFGGEAVMTGQEHRCGTERVAQAAAQLDLDEDEIVVNIQGDEPEMPPHCVDTLVKLLDESDAPMATLATGLPAEQVNQPGKVKVVCDVNSRALYFSRAPIPFDRDSTGQVRHLLHMGIYAYRAWFLRRLAKLDQTPAERAEKLEQLRAIENGFDIIVGVVEYDGVGIDTLEDYRQFVEKHSQGK